MAESSVAPAPAAAPAQAPAPAAQPAAAKADPASTFSKPTLDSAFADLDKLGATETSVSRKEEATPDDKGKAADDAADQQAATKTDQPGDKGKPAPVKAATIREALDQSKSQVKTLQARVQELETQVKTPKADPNAEKATKEVEALRQKVEDYENKLRFTNFEQSEEYKSKYEKPLMDAYASGQAKAKAFKVQQLTDENSGEVKQQARQGTPEDFDRIMSIQDDDAAADLAATLFGQKAAAVLFHRERVQEANGARFRAIEDFKKTGAERVQQETQRQAKEAEAMTKAFESQNTADREKYATWFKPAEGDEAGNAVLERGYQIAQMAFDQAAMAKLTTEQRVRVWSAVMNKAGGFDRLASQHKAQAAKIAELEKQLKEFQESEPGSGDPKGKQAAAKDTFESVFDKIDKMAQ